LADDRDIAYVTHIVTEHLNRLATAGCEEGHPNRIGCYGAVWCTAYKEQRDELLLKIVGTDCIVESALVAFEGVWIGER
jgi:hypothetical protein